MSLVESYKQYGLKLFSRAFKNLLRKVGIHWESFYLLRCAIDIQSIENKMLKYNYVDVKEINLCDFEKSNYFNSDKLKLYQNRFDSGHYSCFGIFSNDELIYSTWISWKNMNFPTFFNKTDVLNENEALLEDSFCHPNYRGKGLHSKMNLFRLKIIHQHAKEFALALVLKENTPAMKVQQKSGFILYKKITFLKIFNKKTIKETPCS